MKTKLRKTYNLIIQLLIIFVTFGFIYKKVFLDRDPAMILEQLGERFLCPLNIFLLSLVILSMFLNYGIESVKWRFLIKKIENISLFRSFKAVFAGITISTFTPNRTGEFLGRVFILEKANHIEGILITIIGSISQFIITFILGSLGIAILVWQYKNPVMDYLSISTGLFHLSFLALSLLALAMYAFIILLYLNVSYITTITNKLISERRKKLRHYLGKFALYDRIELVKVLLLSLLRYMVFTIQFYVLLMIFNVKIPPIEAVVLINAVFFLLTMIPTVAITELGIRGSVALYLFGIYFTMEGISSDSADPGIVSATSMIWLINFVIPALMGALFAFNLKFFRKND